EGGAVRTAFESVLANLGLDRFMGGGSQGKSVAFTIAVIALCAKLSKADGVSTYLEARAFEEVYHVPPEERANVERLYEIARQDVAGYDVYADRVARLLEGEPELKRSVLE